MRPVINASGVVLHTNLGRAPLSDAAIKAVTNVARGYCNLEMDLDSGERGERYSHVEKLLCELTGAEAALVVNNNAGAVLLALHALAREKEVVVARGELVEIGGSFRIPEVMAQSGAVLREVGTTNRTYPRDYERAVGTDTALFLKVHPSNFRVVGFTREVMRRELVEVGRRHQIPVMEDLGSGVFVDLQQYGIDPEPTVQETLAAGIDIVTVSGDKLLGGPQAGIILGRAEMVQLLKEDPLLRALRIDKMTLAALEATLRAYLQEDVQKKSPCSAHAFHNCSRAGEKGCGIEGSADRHTQKL
ncbi:L-seryl-tRNA(Sec) selenium transferase (Part 2) [Syntrophaceticus schinkii]|uniref:L-seryl-tRNA(Sec) selenium transferase n=1 Tax=Syntrophaceticus schinkii TaxID=499207 RepID=A0A0B7MHQ1_9FIRM|nr:L-seryl-tRNA(Sec) selenium transferase (Part 2) [Syntrophaceticus schinkii]